MGGERDYIDVNIAGVPETPPWPESVISIPPDQPVLPPPPPEVAKAIIEVIKTVKPLVRDSQINEGPRRYKYAGVDAFYEALGPLMAAKDLNTVLVEGPMAISDKETKDSYGKTKISTWMETTYFIYLFHASGAMWGPFKRAISVRADGPQSFGMGPSYVEKYFLRSLFKVSTGEEDADAHPKDGVPTNWSKARSEKDSEPDQSQTDDLDAVYDWMRRAKKEYHVLIDANRLRGWWTNNLESMREVFGSPPLKEFDTFKAEYLDYAKTLSPSQVAGDPNPKAAVGLAATANQGVTSGRVDAPPPADDPTIAKPSTMLDDDVPF